MVTRALPGLGREFCLDLTKAGCKIVAAARRTDRLKSLCEEINRLNNSSSSAAAASEVLAVAVELDLSAKGSVIDDSVQKAWDAFGQIDVLVNNAGVRDDPLEKRQQRRDDENSDMEDDLDMACLVCGQTRKGKDIQGIPWENRSFSRDEFREARLKQYKNYVNLLSSGQDLGKECKEVVRGTTFYGFQFNTRFKPTVVHFQMLKNGNELLSFVTL